MMNTEIRTKETQTLASGKDGETRHVRLSASRWGSRRAQPELVSFSWSAVSARRTRR